MTNSRGLLTGAVKPLPAASVGGTPVWWRRPLGAAEVILGGAVASAVAPRPTAVALVVTFAGFTLRRLQVARTGADCACGGGPPTRTDAAAVVASVGLLAVAVLARGTCGPPAARPRSWPRLPPHRSRWRYWCGTGPHERGFQPPVA